ncbi:DUF4221 family protein [Aquiflexum lacus]|uniref:DUF4221 family protein n=1 Tax=Aquiflexum lacus TaxID=2483805 RepID=UPI0018953BE0|nr:DUF4221 family protein [Aquiflexum lacus]
MKNHLIILLSVLWFACGGNETETKTDFSNITFTMDTVVVDPGNEIINLKNGLWQSAFTDDKKFLFLWSQDEGTLDRINLDQLKLEDKIKFEKEGPDGVGSYVSWLYMVDNDQVLLANFQDIGLFDISGKKLKNYNLAKTNFESEGLKEGENFNRKSILTKDGNIMYGMLGNWIDESWSLAKVNFKDRTLKRIELSGIDELPDYSITLKMGEMTVIVPSDKTIQKIENRIILSNSAYNTLHIIEMDTDSLYQINYTPKLTASAKKGGYPKEVDSEKRLRELMNEIHSEINFMAPIWDPITKRFYRFSYETTPNEPTDKSLFEEEEIKPVSKVYLTLLDENFKLLGESVVAQLQQPPSSTFVKDGKIWYYVNVDDELGFVRMSFN